MFLLLAFQPVLLWLALHWLQQRKQQQFADPHLLPWIQVRQQKSRWQVLLSRNMAYSLAWLLLVLALAGPRVADTNNKEASIVDVMLVIDLSASMNARDIKPSRLQRASLEVYEFLSKAKNANIGVIVYAARPHVLAPLTNDHHALKFYLQSLDSLQLPTQGGDAVAALNLAGQSLLALQQQRKQAVVWISDGDIELSQVNALKATIKHLLSQKITTSILGVGTVEGSAIPALNGGWIESKGQGVVSQMNVDLLQSLSQLGEGAFSFISDSDADWNHLYQKGILSNLPKIKNEDAKHWQEFYGILLLPAIFLLIIALMPFSYTVLIKNIKRSTSLLLLFCIVFSMTIDPAYAKSEREKSYPVAIVKGIEAYKIQRFIIAKQAFIQAVLSAQDDQQRALALHNLGNTLFKIGDYSNAEQSFTDALRYAPKQRASQQNLRLSMILNIVLAKRRAKSNNGSYQAPTGESLLLDLPETLAFTIPSTMQGKAKATLPKMPLGQWRILLDKGLEHLHLTEGEAEKSVLQQQKYDLVQARILLMNLEVKNALPLWKRLFEIEEGFPAKLEQPVKIPEVQPW
ncbi:MAG: VWA domain-containing protein [Thiotrichaceae bacterium]|nr:VWA domain-containing protein [Thiotrichaceae bacterium]